jgi:hypothetical protein
MSNNTIGVRITHRDHRLLVKVCRARGEDISDFVRRSIRKELATLSFLPEAEKRALGISSIQKEVSANATE